MNPPPVLTTHMTENNTPEPILTHAFTGQLEAEEHQHDVTGTLTVARDGTIHITFDPLPITQATTWLLQAVPSRTRTAPWTTLRATTSDGHTITTEYLTLNSKNTSMSPDAPPTMALSGQASQLTIKHAPPPADSTACVLIYHTIGMRGFSRQHTSTDVGEIYLLGQATIDNYDEIAGRLHAIAPPGRPLAEWIEEADETLQHLLKILSLAEGKPLTWSIRELYANDHLVQIDLYGARHTGTPEDNTFHFLDLQPILTLAATNYTKELREQTGMDRAIELFLTHPTHLELRLITAMTALEHLVSIYDNHHPATSPYSANSSSASSSRSSSTRATTRATSTVQHGSRSHQPTRPSRSRPVRDPRRTSTSRHEPCEGRAATRIAAA